MQKGLDTFFTLPEVAAWCVKIVSERGWLGDGIKSLEPSSGDGVFLKFIPGLVCLDINPQHAEAEQQDFLTWTPSERFDLIIGNPPFGKRNSLSTAFLNKASTMCSRIAFILPKSYKRPATIDQIDPMFWPVGVHDLPTDKFRVSDTAMKKIGCVFMLWERRDVARPLFKTILDIKQEPHTVRSVEDAEYVLRHSGASSGKIISKDLWKNGTCYLLVGQCDRVGRTDWSSLVDNGGAGTKSLTLSDIHLAFKMMDAGQDYKTGAIGYLQSMLAK